MNFNDLFKSSFLENVTSFSALDMIIALVGAFVIGLFIFLIYKKTYTGVMYSASFGVSLIGLSIITTFIILAVTSNIILSLGMVGALSIVRFRAAIKEPLDIVFLFWSISVGIVLGAGLIPLGILGSAFIGIVLMIFVNIKSSDSPYIMVVTAINPVKEENIINTVTKGVKKYMIKSKTLTAHGMEMTLEVRLNNGDTRFLEEVKSIEGMQTVALVSYNGDYMS